jgi:hypothetical protein
MDKPLHPKTHAGEVLMFLADAGRWCTWGQGYYMPSVQQVLPVGTKEEVQLRYMQMLQRKGLVGGCDCGCRGDYEPTEEGLKFLENECVNGEPRILKQRER